MKKILMISMFVCLFFSGCKDIMLEKNIKKDVQGYINKDYGKYAIIVNKVTLTGENKVYNGNTEISYNGKTYNVPIEVKGSSSSWEWQMKFDVFIIKEEAEKAVKDLAQDNFNKNNIPISIKAVSLFPNNENSYKGIISIDYLGQSKDLNIDVNHSFDNGIMFNIPPEELSFLNY